MSCGRIGAIALVLALAGFAGCASDPRREADRAYQGGQAAVAQVEVYVLPGGFRTATAVILIRGHLPDRCTEIDDVDHSALGARILVEITTRRPFGALCAPQVVPWQRSVQIPDLERGGLYSAEANGVRRTFAVPGRS